MGPMHQADAERRALTAEELVNKLKALDCKLSVAGDRLVVTPGGEHIPPLLLMELRQHKAPVMALLKRRLAPPAPPIAPLSAPPLRGSNGLNRKPNESADLDNTSPPLSALTSTSPSSPSLPSKRQREREEWAAAKRAILLYCRVTWPRAFNPATPLPLAIGVREVITEAAGDRLAADNKISWFLRWWTHRIEYLEAIARGGQRYHLDGSPAGEITEEQRTDAERRIEVHRQGATRPEAAD
jgi:hypothetical protein